MDVRDKYRVPLTSFWLDDQAVPNSNYQVIAQ